MDRPTVIDLFAGGGGFSYGFREAGYKIVFANDIDKNMAKNYVFNIPEVLFIVRDIHFLNPHKDVLEKIDMRPGELDVLIGGPPCQGFSLMGLRNPNDPRNRLLEELFRFIDAIRPRWILLENVPGILNMEGGRPFKLLLNGLERRGYSVTYKILNAVNFGIPQKRKRVFILANNTGDPLTYPPPTHEEKANDIRTLAEYFEGVGDNLKAAVTLRDAIGDLPRLKAGESKDYYETDPLTEYQEIMRVKSPGKLYNHIAPNHTQEVIERIRKTKPGEPVPYRFPFEKKRLRWDEPAPTLLDGPRPTWHYAHPEDDRGLSVRERARIASFPDNYIFQGSLPIQRRVTGEAVPPLLAKIIAKEIKKYL